MKFANLKQDLWISICCAFVLNYVKEFYCWLSSPVLRHLRKVNPEQSQALEDKQHRNAVRHWYNGSLHGAIVLYGVILLRNKEWFPWYMGGSCDFLKVY